jgi:hypothetical protein
MMLETWNLASKGNSILFSGPVAFTYAFDWLCYWLYTGSKVNKYGIGSGGNTWSGSFLCILGVGIKADTI